MFFFWGGKQKERKKERKKNPTTPQDSSQSLDSDLALQMSNSLKAPELSISMFSEENSLTPHPLYLAQRDKVLDVSEKRRKGWK